MEAAEVLSMLLLASGSFALITVGILILKIILA